MVARAADCAASLARWLSGAITGWLVPSLAANCGCGASVALAAEANEYVPAAPAPATFADVAAPALVDVGDSVCSPAAEFCDVEAAAFSTVRAAI